MSALWKWRKKSNARRFEWLHDLHGLAFGWEIGNASAGQGAGGKDDWGVWKSKAMLNDGRCGFMRVIHSFEEGSSPGCLQRSKVAWTEETDTRQSMKQQYALRSRKGPIYGVSTGDICYLRAIHSVCVCVLHDAGTRERKTSSAKHLTGRAPLFGSVCLLLEISDFNLPALIL